MENETQRKGRGARLNVPNRYERLDVDVAPSVSPPHSRSIDIRYFEDASEPVLSRDEQSSIPLSYSLDPYQGCPQGWMHYYNRPSENDPDISKDLGSESRIFVKTQAPRLLSKTFQRDSWEPQVVSLSNHTDPYQPAEREFRITRKCLEVFALHRNPLSITTASDLIRRDLDLLRALSARNLVSVAVSLPSLDESLSMQLEPQGVRPSLRLEAIEALSKHDIPVGALVAPVIPGLNDDEIAPLLTAAAEHGASFADYQLLQLPPPADDLFERWLEQHFPNRKAHILGRLQSLHQGNQDAEALSQRFLNARQQAQLTDRRPSLSTSDFRRLPGGQIGLFDPK